MGDLVVLPEHVGGLVVVVAVDYLLQADDIRPQSGEAVGEHRAPVHPGPAASPEVQRDDSHAPRPYPTSARWGAPCRLSCIAALGITPLCAPGRRHRPGALSQWTTRIHV